MISDAAIAARISKSLCAVTTNMFHALIVGAKRPSASFLSSHPELPVSHHAPFPAAHLQVAIQEGAAAPLVAEASDTAVQVHCYKLPTTLHSNPNHRARELLATGSASLWELAGRPGGGPLGRLPERIHCFSPAAGPEVVSNR